MNLHDLLAIPRRRTPEEEALVFGALELGRLEGGGERWGYGELLEAAERMAAGLAERGIGRGDRVALYLGNGPGIVLAYLAVLRLGAIAVPMNLAYRRPEIAHVLNDAEPRVLVTGREQREVVDGLSAEERGTVREVLWEDDLLAFAEGRDGKPGGTRGSGPPASEEAGGAWPHAAGRPDPATDAGEQGGKAGGAWKDGAAEAGSPGRAWLAGAGERAPGPAAGFPVVDGSDLALLLYTSGTTGRSKGARISHDNLLATVTGLLAAWGWREDDRLLLTLPLFHTHGLVVGLFTALAAGATVLLERRFDADRVAEALLAGREGSGGGSPTVFFGVPTIYVRLVDELRRRRDRGGDTLLPHVRLFASGSAPLAPETFAAFRDLTGHAILERYGMTETGMNLSNPYAGPRLPGTVGRPLPGVSARIVDEDGRPVADGGEGELWVAGSNVFSGYWRDPEKTAEGFVDGPDGRRWFRTGDLARRDPDTGHVTLLGRRHELILTGGYNVYPREVEEALEALPGVREAAVAGVPDRDRGELVAAWLVLEEGAEWAAPASGRKAADERAPGGSAADGSGREGSGAGADRREGGEAGADRHDPEALAAHLRELLQDRLADFKLPRCAFRVDDLPRNALGKVQKHRLPGRGAS